MLQMNNIYKTFNVGTVNEKTALRNLSLTLEDGDFVTVIGGNGAGKSTMLNAIAGTWPVDNGSIVIDGIDVTKCKTTEEFLDKVWNNERTKAFKACLGNTCNNNSEGCKNCPMFKV